MTAHVSLPPPDYERTDGSPGGILATAAGLAVGIAIALGVAAWVYPPSSVAGKRGLEARFENGPQARTGIERDWALQDRLVQEHLETYGWVDRNAGVVRIPIDRAMELLAAPPPPEGRQ